MGLDSGTSAGKVALADTAAHQLGCPLPPGPKSMEIPSIGDSSTWRAVMQYSGGFFVYRIVI